jgi:outer membrane protein
MALSLGRNPKDRSMSSPRHHSLHRFALAALTCVRQPLARQLPLTLLLGGLTVGAQAQNLVDLYQAAKGYDAAYLSAKAQAESAQFKAAQAYAQRRPQIGLKASILRQHFDSDDSAAARAAAASAAAAAAGAGGPSVDTSGANSINYTTTNKSIALQARQSLYNRSVSASIEQADQSIIAAQADLKSAEDDLVARLSQAYFDVLGARDVLATAQANKKALSEQLASDTREAQARFDLATAQEIAAENDLKVKSIALDQFVGQQDVKPRPMMTPVSLPALVPASADEWVAMTVNAPVVRKAEVGVTVATLETKKARAERLPTVDLVASVSRSDVDGSGPITVLASGGATSNIGVEMNVPLYTGGATGNKIQESLLLQEKSERDLDNAKRSVTLATRQAFFGVQSGMAQVKALEAAENSAKLALEATQLGYRVGVRVNKDVLDAQTALSSTQKDLYKARYDVLVGTIKLRQASGSLKPEDLETLNRLLAPN